jgi:hypothetical protein
MFTRRPICSAMSLNGGTADEPGIYVRHQPLAREVREARYGASADIAVMSARCLHATMR